jgi:uncharacterized membrane protein
MRIKKWFHRTGIALAIACALLSFFNLFDSSPTATRNALGGLAVGAGLYVLLTLTGWLIAGLLRNRKSSG